MNSEEKSKQMTDNNIVESLIYELEFTSYKSQYKKYILKIVDNYGEQSPHMQREQAAISFERCSC